MKRILITLIDKYPHVGGKSTHITYLKKGLEELGINVDIISNNDINKLEALFGKCMLQFYKLRGKSCYLYHVQQMRKNLLKEKIAKKLKKESYQFVSCQDAVSAAIFNEINSAVSSNITLTMHTYFGIENSLDADNIKTNDLYYQKMLEYELESLKRVKKVVAVDSRIKEHVDCIVKTKGYGIKTYVIPNFVDANHYMPNNKIKNEKEKLKIICVRRLVEKNGVIYAVKAMKNVRDCVEMHILGDGPQLDIIKKYIDENGLSGKVYMHGAVPNCNIIKFYNMCDAAIIPSITVNGLQEATSISALEAMSCEMPVIVSGIGGLKELVTDGEDGLIVQEKNPDQITKAINWICDNRAEAAEIGKRARQKVIMEHSYVSAAKEYLSIFEVNN